MSEFWLVPTDLDIIFTVDMFEGLDAIFTAVLFDDLINL